MGAFNGKSLAARNVAAVSSRHLILFRERIRTHTYLFVPVFHSLSGLSFCLNLSLPFWRSPQLLACKTPQDFRNLETSASTLFQVMVKDSRCWPQRIRSWRLRVEGPVIRFQRRRNRPIAPQNALNRHYFDS